MSSKDKQKKIWWIFAALSLLQNFSWTVLFFNNPDGLQRQLFFVDKDDFFMDFFNTVSYSMFKSPYTWGNLADRNYLPFTYMIMYPFSKLFDYQNYLPYGARYLQTSIIMAVMFMTISWVFFYYILFKADNGKEYEKIVLFISLFFSGVSIYNFDRANLINLAVACVFTFLITYKSEKEHIRHLGYICLAIASVMKVFPVIFGVLIIYEKKWKEAMYTLLYGVLFAILPFFWLGEDAFFQMQCFVYDLIEHSKVYVVGEFGFEANNILNIDMHNGIIKVIGFILVFVGVILGGLLKEEWKKIAIYSLAFILISGQQGYYCYIILFLPIVLFFRSNKGNALDWGAMILFLLILSPLQYYFSGMIFVIEPKRIINTASIIMFMFLVAESIRELVYTIKKN